MRFNYYSFLGFVIVAFLLIGVGNIASAQIKIGTNGTIIAPSSILELESNNQGLLLPRLTDTVAINALNPPNGMLIYLTKWPAVGLYVRKTTGWEFLTGSLGGNGTFNDLTVGGTLIAQNFSGNLIGNASTATLATTATNAVNVNITNDLSTSTVTYPTFVTNTPGSTSMRTSSTKLSFVPNTGILTAIGFKGNLVGNVTGVATSSIDAVNASNTDVEDDVVSNSIQYPTFVTATDGNLPQKTSSTNLTYIPLTGELKALKFNGSLQGNASSATLAEDAVNSQNSRITDDMVTSAVSYPVFVNSIFGNQPIKSSSSNLTYLPSTGILTAKGFVGNLTGDVTGTVSKAKDADNAAKIQVVENSIGTNPFYPTFVSGTVGPLSATINSSKLKYIPATGEFFSPIFKGELIGNASTTTTATNAANVAITNDSANSLPTYPVFVNAITGNQALKSTSTFLSYVPSTGILTAKGFVGNLTGDVSGQASSALNANNANNAINATNTLNSAISDDNSSINKFYPTFVGTTSGNQAIKASSTNLSYVPSTGILTAKGFVGNLVGDVTGKVSNAQLADNASNLEVGEVLPSVPIYYPTLVPAITGQTSIKVNNSQLQYLPTLGELISTKFRGELIGNASSTTTATNASNVSVTDDIVNNLQTYPVFVNSPTGNQAVKSSSTNLSYVPSTGILTAKGFVGNLVGNVTGEVSNALNSINAVNSTNAINATNTLNSAISDDNSSINKFYPTFVGTTSGNQAIKASSTNLSYVPSTGILTAKGFVGNLVGDVTGKVSNAQLADNASNLEVGEVLPSVPVYYPTLVPATTGQTSIKVNNSQLQYLPTVGELISTKFRGELIGNASSTTTATNAANVSVTDDIANNLPTYPVFVNSPTGNQAVKSSSTNLSYIPSTGILTAKGFVGNLVGNVTGEVSNALNAVNAANINVSADDISAATVYPVFVSGITGALKPNVSTNRLGFKPLTGELTAPIFRGEFMGNATTATSTTTATNSVNSAITDDNANTGTFFPVFVGTASGNQAIKASSNNLKYVPQTGILSATGFAGPLVGNVTGQATSALSAVSATDATTAENAKKSEIIDDASHSAETYPLFVNNAAGNQPLRSNGVNLKYIPSTGTLKAKEFEGKFIGDLNGIATNALDATNSANISITDDLASNAFMPLTFVNGNSGSLPVKVSSSKLRFNPSTGELIAPTFSAPNGFIGNASTATTISPTGLVLPVNGGTGLTSYAPGDILYAESANALKKLPIGPFGSVLRVAQPAGAGTALIPSWASTGPGTITEVQYGGTGLSSIAPGGVLIGNGTNNISTVSGSIGQVLRSNGPGVAPSFQNAAGGDMILAAVQQVTGEKLFGTPGTGLGGTPGQTGKLRLAGRTESFTILDGPESGKGGTVYLPQSGTLVTLDGIETLSGKILTSPTLTSPTIGDATGSSLDVSGTIKAGNFEASSATLTDLKVDNPIDGNIIGNASTVTTNAALTGEVNTVSSNKVELINDAVISKVLNGYVSAAGVVSATDNIVQAIGKLNGNITAANLNNAANIAANSNADHTGDVTGATDLKISDNAVTTFKIASSAVTFSRIEDVATNTVLGRATAGTGVLEEIATTGTGKVVREISPTLVSPILGDASATSLTLSGLLKSNIPNGTTPFEVLSSTPVANLSVGGNAGSATKLETARTINGVPFDGTSNINAPSASLSTEYIDWDATSGGKSIKNKPTITSGTVTSVSATVPPFLTVTGVPITNSGVISINYTSGVGLPVANGGTGLTSFINGGALYATSATTLTSGTLPVTAGGTGQSNFAVGDMLYASTASALAKLPSVAAGNALISNGVGVAPTWGKIDLATHILGTIPVSLGGTGSSTQNFVDLTMPQSIAGIKTFTSKIVGDISGNADGNAATATKLAATRTIYGNAFDGIANLDQVIAPAFGGTGNRFTEFVGPTGTIKKFTLPDNDAVLARTDAAQTFNGVQTFSSTVIGSISGNAATATIASGLNPSTTLTSPNLITPLLGTASATSINKVIITPPAVSATLSLADGSTLATSGANSITLTSTGPTNVTLPTSGTLVRAISFAEVIDFSSVDAGKSQIMNVGFVGTANPGDVVSIGLPDALASSEGVFTVWISGSNAVSIKFTNTSTAPIELPAGTIKFKIFN